jgi:hypothetical protein
MFVRIETTAKPPLVDAAAQHFLQSAAHRLPPSLVPILSKIRWVRILSIYWIEARLSREVFIDVLSEILLDPVSLWLFSGNLMPSAAGKTGGLADLLEVAPIRPGKFWGVETRFRSQKRWDPAAAAVIEAFQICLGEPVLVRAKTGKLLVLEGAELTEKDVYSFAKAVWVNDVVETWTILTDDALVKNDRFYQERIKYDLPHHAPQTMLKTARRQSNYALSQVRVPISASLMRQLGEQKKQPDVSQVTLTSFEHFFLASLGKIKKTHVLTPPGVLGQGNKPSSESLQSMQTGFQGLVSLFAAGDSLALLLRVVSEHYLLLLSSLVCQLGAPPGRFARTLAFETFVLDAQYWGPNPYDGDCLKAAVFEAIEQVVQNYRIELGISVPKIEYLPFVGQKGLKGVMPQHQAVLISYGIAVLESSYKIAQAGWSVLYLPWREWVLADVLEQKTMMETLEEAQNLGLNFQCEAVHGFCDALCKLLGPQIGIRLNLDAFLRPEEGFDVFDRGGRGLQKEDAISWESLSDLLSKRFDELDIGLFLIVHPEHKTLLERLFDSRKLPLAEVAELFDGASIDAYFQKTLVGQFTYHWISRWQTEGKSGESAAESAAFAIPWERAYEQSPPGANLLQTESVESLDAWIPKLAPLVLQLFWGAHERRFLRPLEVSNFDLTGQLLMKRFEVSPWVSQEYWSVQDQTLSQARTIAAGLAVGLNDALIVHGHQTQNEAVVFSQCNSFELAIGRAGVANNQTFASILDLAMRRAIAAGVRCKDPQCEFGFSMIQLGNPLSGVLETMTQVSEHLDVKCFSNQHIGSEGPPLPGLGSFSFCTAFGEVPDLKSIQNGYFKMAGHFIYYVGPTPQHLQGSALFELEKGQLPIDWEPPHNADWPFAEKLYKFVSSSAARSGVLKSIRAIGQGGLLVAVAQSFVSRGLGAYLSFDVKPSLICLLFGETMHQFLISVAPSDVTVLEHDLGSLELPYLRIGYVENHGRLDVAFETKAAGPKVVMSLHSQKFEALWKKNR